MATVPGFAQGICPPLAYRRNGHQATFANAAEFFNSLLGAAGTTPSIIERLIFFALVSR